MFEINRRGVSLFGAEIRWYGLLIALGVLGAVLQAMAREKKLGLKKDTGLNLALILVPAGVVCARIYYVLFSWDFYREHPAEIFNLRGGGIAVYGAVIGGALAALVYAKVTGNRFAVLVDLAAPGLAFGQAVGRWGNFFNQEAYGALVENPALQFFPLVTYIEGSGWHYAAFFYESLWCAVICALLLVGERKKLFRRRGDMFLVYAFLYALERSIVEGLRTDSLYVGPFRVSQLLSFAALLALTILLCVRAGGSRWGKICLVAATLLFGAHVASGGGMIVALALTALTLACAAAEYRKTSRESLE